MADETSRTARDMFGVLPDGRTVERVVLRGAGGFEARVVTYGATLQTLIVPDMKGHGSDVVLGHDSLGGYLAARRFSARLLGVMPIVSPTLVLNSITR